MGFDIPLQHLIAAFILWLTRVILLLPYFLLRLIGLEKALGWYYDLITKIFTATGKFIGKWIDPVTYSNLLYRWKAKRRKSKQS